MANVDVTNALSSPTHQTKHGNVVLPYRTEVTVDIAKAVAKKGSALAASDVIQSIRVPGKSGIMWGGVTVIEPLTGTYTAGTIDVGTTDDADAFVDGFDIKSAAKGDFAAQPAAYQPIVRSQEGTIDVTLATLTGGELTGGKLAVWAVLLDLAPIGRAGLAKVGS